MTAGVSRPRVVVKLRGGLGNQMFQYAAARAMAERFAAGVDLDTTKPDRNPHWRYRLDPFDLDVTRVRNGSPPPSSIRRTWPFDRLRRRISGLPIDPNLGIPILRQKGFPIDDIYFSWTGSCVLAGYWQSERCFAETATRIREDFALDRFAGARTRPTIEKIDAGASVSIHVRRGHYVQLSKTSFFTLCERDYYDRARRVIEKRVPSPRWFVFSDDADTARDLLGDWPNADFVTGFDDYEDLMLMARCRHHIIANSTFSWWGAWLGEDEGTTVVAPRQWFAPHAPHDTRDLLPARWFAV